MTPPKWCPCHDMLNRGVVGRGSRRLRWTVKECVGSVMADSAVTSVTRARMLPTTGWTQGGGPRSESQRAERLGCLRPGRRDGRARTGIRRLLDGGGPARRHRPRLSRAARRKEKWKMIASGIVREIRRLLDQGELSQRKIAASTGVSRGTVSAIARGARPDYDARRRERGEDFIPPSGVARRCPGCGRLVQMPCLACRALAMRKKGR